MTNYCDDLDNSMILSISFLVANITVSVFLNGRNIFHVVNPGMVDWLLGLQDGCFHYKQWFVCSLIQHCVHFALTYSRRSKKGCHCSYDDLLHSLTCRCLDYLGN